MSVDVQKLEAKLQELTGERDAVGSTKTLEDAAAIATSFAEVARRDEVAGLILNAHAYGEPLQRVLNAYTASDSGLTFEEWLVETAQSQGFELNEKDKAARLKALDAEIASVTANYRKALVAQAKAETEAKVKALEASFSGEAA